MGYRNLLEKLKGLPKDRRDQLVVRSMPFGDIIEDDSRKVHGTISKIKGGPERLVRHEDGTTSWYAAGRDWQFLAYGICRAAKGHGEYEAAIDEFL